MRCKCIHAIGRILFFILKITRIMATPFVTHYVQIAGGINSVATELMEVNVKTNNSMVAYTIVRILTHDYSLYALPA